MSHAIAKDSTSVSLIEDHGSFERSTRWTRSGMQSTNCVVGFRAEHIQDKDPEPNLSEEIHERVDKLNSFHDSCAFAYVSPTLTRPYSLFPTICPFYIPL